MRVIVGTTIDRSVDLGYRGPQEAMRREYRRSGAVSSFCLAIVCWGLLGVAAEAAAGPSILVLASAVDDDRIAPAREAISFWNDRLAEFELGMRFDQVRVVVGAPVARTLETYARQIVTRAVQLPAGNAEPRPPAALTALTGDIVVLLSRQDIMSFTWPMPKVSPPRYFIVIRKVRGPYRHDAMVTRHVVAHELGHALGLDHNAEPHTLMCGPCEPLLSESDDTGFLPLTEGDRARLRARYFLP